MSGAPAPVESPRRAVLLGVGNILLTDEGVGVRAVERFGERYVLPEGVEILDGGTSAMEMLDELENLDLLVVVDCVRVGRPPASVVVLTGDEVPAFFRQRLSPHQVGLSDVFATMLLTGRAPQAIVVIGVQPVAIELSMSLTPEVEAVMPEVLDAIHSSFEANGYTVSHAGRGPGGGMMCLSVPMQIVELEADGDLAIVKRHERRERVNMG
jgi:hydrogenase maturation protease